MPEIMLELPQNSGTRTRLEAKLEEYRGEMKRYEERPDNTPQMIKYSPEGYGVVLIEKLFEDGQVDLVRFARELEAKEPIFYLHFYNQAAQEVYQTMIKGQKPAQPLNDLHNQAV